MLPIFFKCIFFVHFETATLINSLHLEHFFLGIVADTFCVTISVSEK